MNQKLEFAERLQAAMRAAGLEPRPAVLLNLFNANYWGRSVTFQAVSRWLRGESIPAQDKLIVLAGVLKVEPEVSRFGGTVRKSVREHHQRWEQGVGYLERETFDAFLQAIKVVGSWHNRGGAVFWIDPSDSLQHQGGIADVAGDRTRAVQ